MKFHQEIEWIVEILSTRFFLAAWDGASLPGRIPPIEALFESKPQRSTRFVFTLHRK